MVVGIGELDGDVVIIVELIVPGIIVEIFPHVYISDELGCSL